MAAEVNGKGDTFEVGAVRPLFDIRRGGPGAVYDSHGRRRALPGHYGGGRASLRAHNAGPKLDSGVKAMTIAIGTRLGPYEDARCH